MVTMRRRWVGDVLRGGALLLLVAGLSLRIGVTAPTTAAQSPDEAAALRELAERLLAPSLLGPGAQPQSARLLPERLPDGLPVELVFPPGSRIVGSLVRLVGNEPVGATAVAEAPGAAASILAFYDTTLTAAGWVVSPFFGGPGNPPGGLQPTLLPISRGYCRSQRGPSLSVTVLPRTAGPSDVRLDLETLFPFGCETFGRELQGAALLPPLYTPPGVELLPSNPPQPVGGGKPAQSSSDGIAETDLSIADLEAHLADQLAAAGWQPIDRVTEGPVAWSRWIVPGEGEWRGFLFVVEGPGARQRTIHVQVTTAAAPPR